jgi:hypothetical protein
MGITCQQYSTQKSRWTKAKPFSSSEKLTALSKATRKCPFYDYTYSIALHIAWIHPTEKSLLGAGKGLAWEFAMPWCPSFNTEMISPSAPYYLPAGRCHIKSFYGYDLNKLSIHKTFFLMLPNCFCLKPIL